MYLKQMAKEIHADNVSKGFYDDYIECQVPKDYFIMKQLILVVSELSEATEELRKNGINNSLEPVFPNTLDIKDSIKLFEDKYKDKFQDEIADTFIRLLDLCGFLDINIDQWIDAKLEYNKTRPYKHGKKF